METETIMARPLVELVETPSREQLPEIRRLFLDYAHRNYQLRVMNIDKNDMAAYLQDRLLACDNGRTCLSLSHEGSVLDGLARIVPSTMLSERLECRMWSFKHLIVRETEAGYVASSLIDSVLQGIEKEADIVTARIAASDQAVVGALQEQGFRVMTGEVAGIIRFDGPDPEVPEGLSVTSMEDRHVEEVASIAGSVHRYNRFAYDPRFESGSVSMMYGHLIEKYSIDDDTETLVVTDRSGEVLGFISFRLNKILERFAGRRLASLDFIGVRKEVQVRGIGDLLNRSALRALRRRNVEVVTVQTLMSNYNALAVLRKIGFRITSANMVMHRWFK